jgi:glycosyltransferase involved in cell wall biosynthesis
MRYSVALCTYNGARFLEAQLASIAAQTRLPDELVACDDASTDDTVCVLEAFRGQAPFPVRVLVQPRNIGSAKNFEHALRQCTGELIALCDQDDLWLPQRLEASEEFLRSHPDAAFVFTDGQRIDEAGMPIAETLWQSFHFDQALQEQLASGGYSVLSRHRFITGATITLRAELLRNVLPFPEAWVHDEWLAAVTPLYAEIGMLPQRLIQYRSHSAQQVGALRERNSTAEAHWGHIDRVRRQMRDLLAHLKVHPPQRHFELVNVYRARAAAIERRAALPPGRIARMRQVAKHLADYKNHAAGLSSAAKDILLSKPSHLPSDSRNPRP